MDNYIDRYKESLNTLGGNSRRRLYSYRLVILSGLLCVGFICSAADFSPLMLNGMQDGCRLDSSVLPLDFERGATYLCVFRQNAPAGQSANDLAHDALFAIGGRFILGIDKGRIYFNANDDKSWRFGRYSSGFDFRDGKFHTLALSLKSDPLRYNRIDHPALRVSILLDGQQILNEQLLDFSDSPTPTREFKVGFWEDPIWRFTGEIRDVAHFNEALSADKIRSWFQENHADAYQGMQPKQLSPDLQKAWEGLPKSTPRDRALRSAARNLALQLNRFPKIKNEAVVLETTKSILTLWEDPADPNGGLRICSWFDLAANREILAWDNPWFRFLDNRHKGSVTANTPGMKGTLTQKPKRTTDGWRFEVKWDSPDKTSVESEFLFDGRRLQATAKVKNADGAICEFSFPELKINHFNSGTDFLLHPHLAGKTESDVMASGIHTGGRYASGNPSMQIWGYYDSKGGILFMPGETRGELRDFTVRALNGELLYRQDWCLPVAGTPEFDTESKFQLELYAGGWYEAGLAYRRYNTEIKPEWWTPDKDARPRKGTPQWMLNNSFWLMENFETCAENPELFLRIREYLELPYTLHCYTWSAGHPDRDYPNFNPTPEVIDTLRLLQSMDVRFMPYTNPIRWDCTDKRNEDYLFSKMGASACVRDMDGKINTIPLYGDPFATICPETSVYKDVMSRMISTLNKWRFDGLYVDELGACSPLKCYAGNHNHAVPDGKTWFSNGIIPVWKKIMKEARATNPSVGFMTEMNAEPTVAFCDANLTYSWIYRGMVPLFPMVYSGRTQFVGLRYSYVAGCPDDSPERSDHLAIPAKLTGQLLYGGQLGWSRMLDFIKPDMHEFRVWSKQLSHLRNGLLDVFNCGMMGRPALLMTENPAEPLLWEYSPRIIIDTPQIMHSGWEYDGIRVEVLSNVSDKSCINQLLLPEENQTSPQCNVVLFYSDGRTEENRTVDLKKTLKFELAPKSFMVAVYYFNKNYKITDLLTNLRREFNIIQRAANEPDPFFSNAIETQPMASIAPETKEISVRADNYKLVFFPGCMTPAWIGTEKGIRYDVGYFLDHADRFSLKDERWAETEILRNTPTEFVVRQTGTYVKKGKTDETISGSIKVVYTYTLRRNSPVIEVKGLITRANGAPVIENLSYMQFEKTIPGIRIIPERRELKNWTGTELNFLVKIEMPIK